MAWCGDSDLEHQPALGKEEQEDHCAFMTSLGYIPNSGPVLSAERDSTQRKQEQQKWISIGEINDKSFRLLRK